MDTSSAPALGELLDPKPATPPSRTVLTGRLITVAPLNPQQHGKALYEAAGGSDREYLWRYLGSGPFSTSDDFNAWLTTAASQNDPLFFALLDNRSGQAAGIASYLRIEPRQRVVEVGHLLFGPSLQRTAAATEAMYLMARHAFEDLGYRRYEWKCNSLHEGSRRAALRLGFTFEGIFRQHMIIKSRNRDTAWFSMLDSEWPSRKTAFERWLQASNFDASGNQVQSLAQIRRGGNL